jgi:hypothetical protein
MTVGQRGPHTGADRTAGLYFGDALSTAVRVQDSRSVIH